MNNWFKKSNKNGNKPTADDAEVTVEADEALTCRSKKQKFNEKNKASHTKKRAYNKSFFAVWFHFHIEKQ